MTPSSPTVAVHEETRACARCGEMRPLEEYRYSDRPRLGTRCKICRAIMNRGLVRSRTGRGPVDIRTIALVLVEEYPDDAVRPRTRADCAGGVRPCPWISCRHNLYLDVHHGTVKLAHPDVDPADMPADCSCALDVAERGPSTFDHVGLALNMTRAGADQVAFRAAAKLTEHADLADFAGHEEARLGALAEAGEGGDHRGMRPHTEEDRAEPMVLFPGIMDDDEDGYCERIYTAYERAIR